MVKKTYRVKVETQGVEEYLVDAETAAEARENWDDGDLMQSEVWETKVVDVTEETN